MVDTEFVSALRILVAVVPVDLPASQARRVRRAHIKGAAPRVAIGVGLALLDALSEVEARLVVEAAARVALEVIVASIVQRLEAQKANAAWNAFALRAAVRGQTAVVVLYARVPYVRFQHLEAGLGLASAECQTQR